MVAFKSLALFLAVASKANASCQNNATFTAVSFTDDGNPQKNCKQIRQKEERRTAMCVTPEVNAACPHTCGSCCEDDPTYTFTLKKVGTVQDCSWILKNDKKKEIRFNNYCTKNNTKGKLHTSGGRSVRDGCAVSCNYCFTGDKQITVAPTPVPTAAPTPPVTTLTPTLSGAPSNQPTRPPSPMPSPFPSLKPSAFPSDAPSLKPSDVPSDAPSLAPSDVPSLAPSDVPSDVPSLAPSDVPSDVPSLAPSDVPSLAPSDVPSDAPSLTPSDDPSMAPSDIPSDAPSSAPSDDPSDTPSADPTQSIKPSPSPSSSPSKSKEPTPAPTPVPTTAPTDAPGVPTAAPTPAPTSCVDSATFTFPLIFDATVTKTCAWLTQHFDDTVDTKRKTTYCTAGSDVKTNCCASCTGFPV